MVASDNDVKENKSRLFEASTYDVNSGILNVYGIRECSLEIIGSIPTGRVRADVAE
jgi:hypothetical protein